MFISLASSPLKQNVHFAGIWHRPRSSKMFISLASSPLKQNVHFGLRWHLPRSSKMFISAFAGIFPAQANR
jgi:hypothetical protein